MEFSSLIEEKLNRKIGEKTEKMGANAPIFLCGFLVLEVFVRIESKAKIYKILFKIHILLFPEYSIVHHFVLTRILNKDSFNLFPYFDKSKNCTPDKIINLIKAIIANF